MSTRCTKFIHSNGIKLPNIPLSEQNSFQCYNIIMEYKWHLHYVLDINIKRTDSICINIYRDSLTQI